MVPKASVLIWVTESMIRLFEANLSGPEAREQALVFVALCVGGIVLARGIDDRALGDELRKAAERHILAMTGGRTDSFTSRVQHGPRTPLRMREPVFSCAVIKLPRGPFS
jgi:hypothetical protein